MDKKKMQRGKQIIRIFSRNLHSQKIFLFRRPQKQTIEILIAFQGKD